MKPRPLKAFCAAHPVLVAHLLVFGFAPVIHRALLFLMHALLSGMPETAAAAEPLIGYLLVPLYLAVLIRSVNAALAREHRAHNRMLLAGYRIVCIVLLLSILSYLVLSVLGIVLSPLLSKRWI